MALEILSDFSAAYAEVFGPLVIRQMNRKAVLLRRLMKMPGAGKNCAWDVTFSGAAAGTFTEGADVAVGDLAHDIDVPATLAWGEYRSNYGFSSLAQAVARSSNTSPMELWSRFSHDLKGSASKLGSVLNAALYNGTGANAIIGLQTGLATSGTFANISKATYTEWQGNVNTNSGTPRALTKALMDTLEGEIYDACGERPDIIVTTTNVANKYEGLFDAQKQVIVMNDLSVGNVQDTGGPRYRVEDGETGLQHKGVGVLRDKDCPAEHLFMLNSDYLRVRFLPAVADVETSSASAEVDITDGEVSTQLMAKLSALGKKGASDQFTLECFPQLEYLKVNAHGYIDDIDES